MATLTFFPVMIGQIGMGEGEGVKVVDGTKVDAFDRYWPNRVSPNDSNPPPAGEIISHGNGAVAFSLENVDRSKPALLQFMTAGVEFTKSFVTWSYDSHPAPPQFYMWSYEQILDHFAGTVFAGRIIPNQRSSTNSFTQQTFCIPPGQLTESQNLLGIHTRDAKGERVGNRDNFAIANIWILYHVRFAPVSGFPGPITVTK